MFSSTPWRPKSGGGGAPTASAPVTHADISNTPNAALAPQPSEVLLRQLYKLLQCGDVAGLLQYLSVQQSAGGDITSNNEDATLPTLQEAARQITTRDLWGLIRLVLNQLTTSNTDHEAGRPDFSLVEALYPIKDRLALQQRMLTYFITFPLPATSRKTLMPFVSVFVDTLIAFGADMDFVVLSLLRFALRRTTTVSSKSEKQPSFSSEEGSSSPAGTPPHPSLAFLQYLTPDLPWGCDDHVDDDDDGIHDLYERYLDCMDVASDAKVGTFVAGDMQRISWALIADLAARGVRRAHVIIQALLMHPEPLVRMIHLVFGQYAFSLDLAIVHGNRRVRWNEHVSRRMCATSSSESRDDSSNAKKAKTDEDDDVNGGGSLESIAQLLVSDAALLHQEGTKKKQNKKRNGVAEFEDGSDDNDDLVFLTDNAVFQVDENGFYIDAQTAHRMLIARLVAFDFRAGLQSKFAFANRSDDGGDADGGGLTLAAHAHDVFIIHDYHLILCLEKWLAKHDSCAPAHQVALYIIHTCVLRMPRTVKDSALLFQYAADRRKHEKLLRSVVALNNLSS